MVQRKWCRLILIGGIGEVRMRDVDGGISRVACLTRAGLKMMMISR